MAGVSMAGADHPDVTSGELRGPAGGLLALTNHTSTPVRVPVRLPGDATRAESIGPGGVVGLPLEASTVELELPAYGGAIVGWRRGAGLDDR